MFKVGQATIARVEETNLPGYLLRDIFPDFTDALLAEHKGWLAPHHYEAETGKIILSVHSWLLQVGGKKILIDSCCGNNKVKTRPAVLAHAQRAVSRTARSCRRACRRDRSRDVHAPASRSCRLEHAATRRQMGADVSQCAIRLLKTRRRLFFESRRRPEGRAGGVGNVPRVRDPDSRAWKSRPGERRALPPQRVHRDRFRARPFAGPRVLQAGEQWRARGFHRRCVAPSAAGLLSGLEFPEELGRRAGAREPPQGARLLCLKRCAGVSGPCRPTVCWPNRARAKGLHPAFRTLTVRSRKVGRGFRPAPCGVPPRPRSSRAAYQASRHRPAPAPPALGAANWSPTACVPGRP